MQKKIPLGSKSYHIKTRMSIEGQQNLGLTVQYIDIMTVSSYTVADYRPSTVRLQLKTLLPCILDLTPVIEVIYSTSNLLLRL